MRSAFARFGVTRSPYQPWISSLILFGLALLVFGNTVNNGLVYDDHNLIEENPALKSASSLARAFTTGTFQLSDPTDPSLAYRPIGVVSLAFDEALGAGAPWAFHADSLLLQWLNSLLLYLILRRSLGFLGALGLAAWFLTLPCGAEVTLWASGRFDQLQALFILLSIFWQGVVAWRGPAADVVLGLLTLLALGSKESAILLPGLLLAFESGAGVVSLARRYTIQALAVAMYFVFRANAHVSLSVGHSASVSGFLSDYLQVFATNLSMIMQPVPLTITPRVVVLGLTGKWVVATMLIGFVVAAWGWSRLRAGLVWWLGACVPLAAALHGISFGERHTYLPSLGLAMVLGMVGAIARERPSLQRLMPLAVGTTGLVVVLQGIVVHARTPEWRDDGTLFQSALNADPESTTAWHQIGRVAVREQRWEDAAAAFRTGLAFGPNDTHIVLDAVGVLYQLGDVSEAVAMVTHALRVDPDNGRLHYNAGVLFLRIGDTARACMQAKIARELQPNDVKAQQLLAELGERCSAGG